MFRGETPHMRLAALAIVLALATNAFGQQKPESTSGNTGSDFLWKRLETRVHEIADKLDGVIGIAILDLIDGRIFSLNADRVFPTASSIKIAVLLELYRQDQETRPGAKGKARFDDTSTFDPKDLVEHSQITAGLTAGVTNVTNRDLAQFVVAVSDNTAANVLIDRVGMQNVNATLRTLGLYENNLAPEDDRHRSRSTGRRKRLYPARNGAASGNDLQRQSLEQESHR